MLMLKTLSNDYVKLKCYGEVIRLNLHFYTWHSLSFIGIKSKECYKMWWSKNQQDKKILM